MTDEQRVEAFFQRLMSDPNFQQFAILLAPYRVMMGAASVVELVEAVIEHWNATAPQEATTT